MLFSIRSVLWVSVGVVSWLLPRAVGFASLPACLWTVLARAPSQPARRFVPHSRACGSCCSASPAGLAPVPFARDSRSPSRALLHDVWRSACWLRCPWCPTAAASRMWPRLILDLHPIIIVCSPGRSIRAPAGVPCPHLRPRQRCLRFIPALAGAPQKPKCQSALTLVHPRVCGRVPQPSFPGQLNMASSPRVWAGHAGALNHHLGLRFIFASARKGS